MQSSKNLKLEMPSLPKGGGSLYGMGESLGAVGPDGLASLSLPLPVSGGRGVAPSLGLSYSSAAGNGEFGMGWQCGLGSISLRTSQGVPQYMGEDIFLGPSGEVLSIVPDLKGQPDRRTATSLLGTALKQPHIVTRYQPRIISDFSKLEYWQPQQSGQDKPFWVMFSTDGQVHLLGKHRHAQIADPKETTKIACWLLEETVTPTGEHIYYHYRAEDDAGCDAHELNQHPGMHAQRYLAQVCYGNIFPEAAFIAVKSGIPADDAWLFHLVFDYGERSSSLYTVPEYHASGEWLRRPDCFSRYQFGFEVRTRRLCQQVLMFHRLQALAGENVTNEVPALVSRLILDYDLNNRVSLLLSARHLAHEAEGTPVTLAPLEVDYQRFDNELNLNWQKMPELEKFNAFQPYQLVDLYGEGIPGILYQDAPGAWWYRAPMRDGASDKADAVTYETAKPLPSIPVQQDSAMLIDFNGDGRLDWVVTAAGLRGYHTMTPEGEWTPFIPLSSIPVEYFHPQAQFADITGSGLPDLALIGPSSVRFWADTSGGWDKAQDVEYQGSIPLPIPGRDACKLVAFSDMTGSGQPHLVEVSAEGVRCWPNLGRGRFGDPLTLPGFQITGEAFNPNRLSMADMDGSGTTDLIYVRSTYLELYINESGNRFSEPLRIDLPTGARFDDTCRLQIADTQGLGVTAIILTVPHISVQHWRLEVTTHKPWLLNAVNNNMGADTALYYRSSAQFWLDEKQQATEEGRKVASYLPFPVHLLWRTEVRDEITGNRLSSRCDYAHGAWDGREREYRGFGRVTQTDTDELACATRGTQTETLAPSRTVSWFATGISEVDGLLPREYWQGDEQAFAGFTPRFTRYDATTENEVTITPNEEEMYWLSRALKGMPLRSEIYGDDDTELAGTPYSVSESRPQIRLLAGMMAEAPSAWPSMLESRSYQYERIAVDPQCSQQIVLKSDALGFPADILSIAYPRRQKPAVSPYPDTLPETLFDSGYDDQQMLLRLTRQRYEYHHLIDETLWLLGLPAVSRSDTRVLSQNVVPDGGLSLEGFSTVFGTNGAGQLPNTEDDYLGHVTVNYTGAGGKPDFPPLVAYTETAEFNQASLKAFEGIMSPDELKKELENAGWQSVPVPLQDNGGFNVWVGRQGYTDFAGAEGFYRPLAQRQTLMTGKDLIGWDTHFCAVIREQSATGSVAYAQYDYRFNVVNRVTDANDNISTSTFDALGRVTSVRFCGLEEGVMQGYTQPEDEVTPFIVPALIHEALELKPGIPVAGLAVYAPLSWMPRVTTETTEFKNLSTEDNRMGRLALRRYLRRNSVMSFSSNSCLPPHTLNISTDRYDSDPEQQLRQSLSFSDGFGRTLQTAARHEAGQAWQLSDDGTIIADEAGLPINEHTDFRWAVSGRTEYDGKGQPLRTYLPYFLNNWRYVKDDSARRDLFADKSCYDPLGRVWQVVTAAGYLRRTLITPWFVVSEDENDTAAEVSQ
ncbi:SpvB/TcaC N-terminal domain-containing protein [Xenorhabdus bovienii]|uniref:SpvB/TcaC N-terminal domain-containing protein n=1 Tax=Xenorhabdus bovienii TaxID=40576 RepID=UPI0023B20DC1|nr:SpvB/TcaC N-terminal domain-containing protein [Xenorhabdus bovienii]MDE9535786.1 virulence protein [Xenorhabdus bovienii]MDE9587362.1 virulence protein [Xenorhabdus bovienii]